MDFTAPSAKIDVAICNLLVRICNFSDLDFETKMMELGEEEIELIVVKLIEEIGNNLTGKLLGFYLQEIRRTEQEEPFFSFSEDVYFE